MRVADVAVIVPAYDAAGFLGRAIRSVRAQSRPPREIVVVDDGSRDGTADAARALGDDLVVLRQENRGPGAARNRGARAARASLLAFLDADDEYLPEALATLEDALAAHPEAEVASGATLRVSDRATTREPPEGTLGAAGRAVVLADFFAAARRHTFVYTNSVMVRRRAFDAVGGFREEVRFGEDVDLWGRLAGRYAWAYVDVPLSAYHHTAATSATLRTPDAGQPVDLLMPEERMRRFVRPGLWGSYRRYRRDWLCERARGALGRGARERARGLLAAIPPAPPSASWAATWLLARAPLGATLLGAYRGARDLRRAALGWRPGRAERGEHEEHEPGGLAPLPAERGAPDEPGREERERERAVRPRGA
jgi:glycosyltransferase involved in cell wall biosynthesis